MILPTDKVNSMENKVRYERKKLIFFFIKGNSRRLSRTSEGVNQKEQSNKAMLLTCNKTHISFFFILQ